MRYLLQLKGDALTKEVIYLAYRMTYFLHMEGADVATLCEHIMESALENRATLIAQLMIGYVMDQCWLNENYYTERIRSASPIVSLKRMLEIFGNLPPDELTEDVLAMFSCVTAYLRTPKF
ncbi:hypothetical protein [Noviherbaspirillum pedocola]|uniref:Uncharacterized protein n=1 Tax=Noviherbaspirillum pedocola TaxID=2801341 RepID=A0A934SVQ1_9BURK|nr:hypothetical protein [Noviherbaspirillum pedocola]MBK4733637.1 hypothetical protein [Noviherbaspirillum pedocola]